MRVSTVSTVSRRWSRRNWGYNDHWTIGSVRVWSHQANSLKWLITSCSLGRCRWREGKEIRRTVRIRSHEHFCMISSRTPLKRKYRAIQYLADLHQLQDFVPSENWDTPDTKPPPCLKKRSVWFSQARGWEVVNQLSSWSVSWSKTMLIIGLSISM